MREVAMRGDPIRTGGKHPVVILNESIAALNEEISALWRVVRAQRQEIDALHKQVGQLSPSFTLLPNRSTSAGKDQTKSDA